MADWTARLPTIVTGHPTRSIRRVIAYSSAPDTSMTPMVTQTTPEDGRLGTRPAWLRPGARPRSTSRTGSAAPEER